VILRDELPVPLPGLAEAAALSTSGGWVAFTVGRTLRSEMALPSAVASLLSPPPPPERDTPRARTAAAEGRVEGFAAEGAAEAAVEEEASASSAAGVLLSLAAAPLHPASSPPSPPALQSTPATPPLPLLSPRSRSLSARLGALAPVQFCLAELSINSATR